MRRGQQGSLDAHCEKKKAGCHSVTPQCNCKGKSPKPARAEVTAVEGERCVQLSQLSSHDSGGH